MTIKSSVYDGSASCRRYAASSIRQIHQCVVIPPVCDDRCLSELVWEHLCSSDFLADKVSTSKMNPTVKSEIRVPAALSTFAEG